MGSMFNLLRSVAASRGARWIGAPVLVAAALAAVVSQSQTTIPTMSLSAEPLYARGARAKPTLTLALSVEFPTVGAQYRDATYSTGTAYVGYFDTESCYRYNNGSTAATRYFVRSGAATSRACGGDAFSGNFMNWATGSAIDVLRLGLTGGDRFIDDAGQTVLQRAVLQEDFYKNSSYFPAKVLPAAQVAGAVPSTLKGTYAGDIQISNCLNKVHFGTKSEGTCSAPARNANLGVPSGTGGTAQNGSTLMTSDLFFYTRVQVCDSSGGTLSDPRTNLCQRYPNGYFKPVGNLQKYSDRVRVAAFGYLNDSNGNPNERYGGVLRAPMKYVGPKTFDANFTLQSATNGVAEWNESTGQFIANPQGQTSVTSGAYSTPTSSNLSGVVNYLNQFGRTGASQGVYKGYDPFGELYYEAVRYLQGLTPTAQATSGMTTAMKDGYPVYDTWLGTDAPDPHPAVSGMTDYSCVKNSIIGIGDVFTHEDKSIPGNNQRSTSVTPNDFVRYASDAANEPDFHFWTKVVGGFESNNAVSYPSAAAYASGAASAAWDKTTSNISVNSPYNTARWGMENQSTGSNEAAYYMAGIAYWANTHDIRGTQWSETTKQRPGMRVRTYMIDVNERSQSNDATDRTNHQIYLAAKYGGFTDSSGTGNPFKVKNFDGTISDGNGNWAGSNSEAKSYFLASSAQAVLDALDQIFAQIASEANSIAGGAISTQRLTTSGGQIYQAQFDPADWSGDLVAYPVSVSASSVVTIGVPVDSPWVNSASAPVGAAGKLDDLSSVDARKIYVGYNSVTGVFDTTEFKWNSLNSITQDALRMAPYAAASAAMDAASAGENRLKYLRGDRSLETGGTFRRRGSRLGDIVNSGVAYAGTPAVISPDSAFTTFYNTYRNRTKALFVGANDGMLHAFNATTGAELFGYIPSWVVPRLSNLTSPNYVHAAYVDGTPEVAEAKVGSAWKTVLVSGTGGGGQGVFALDVSDSTAFDNSKVMWEFTDQHDAEMGNVIGHPKIIKVNTTAGTSTTTYKYFAVFASGVNNYAADGHVLSSADANFGSPVLFFLDLSKAKGDAWSLGQNYFKVRFPVSTTSMASGMTEFATRLGNSGELTYVYAGDMQGNLWKLDFTGTAASAWTIDALSYYKNGTTAIPMFVAKDSATTPNRQPISMEPALVFGANRSILVSFGTGKFLESSDTAGPYKAQSVYTLLDNNSPTADTSSSPAAAIAGRGRLAQGTWSSGVLSIPTFKWGRPSSDTGSVKSGWVFDFDNSDTYDANGNGTIESGDRLGTGERQISAFGVLSGKLVFGTVIPAVNSCDNGSGNLFIVDVRTGVASVQTSTVGILGEPFLAQVGNSTLTISDTTGRRNETTRYQIILQGSAGLSAPQGLQQIVTGTSGRLSWREIIKH
jgi:type IV pilus assembly protein PilY1